MTKTSSEQLSRQTTPKHPYTKVGISLLALAIISCFSGKACSDWNKETHQKELLDKLSDCPASYLGIAHDKALFDLDCDTKTAEVSANIIYGGAFLENIAFLKDKKGQTRPLREWREHIYSTHWRTHVRED